MTTGEVILTTSRLTLRSWRETDRDAFAVMHADPEVMADLGGPIDRAASNAKLDHYMVALRAHGFGRLAIEDRHGAFAGYAGIMQRDQGPPLGVHVEVGWRLARAAWGKGYATEAAAAALRDVFARTSLMEILSYTSPDNARSQAVMSRLGLERDPARDFTLSNGWRGLVWVARLNSSQAWQAPRRSGDRAASS
jgi:RimJ/RimL family protein N-acetyltransferase